MFNSAIRYHQGQLYIEDKPVADIASQVGTPVYLYSLRRILENAARLQQLFNPLNAHIHYSVKANGNLSILRALVANGLGLDVVSGGEIYRALLAGINPEKIVFAGVGKTISDIQYALDTGVGWFNVENVGELEIISELAGQKNNNARVALRLNPNVTAKTHPYIATGHGGAKFGMTEEVIANILGEQAQYPHVDIHGVHIHIGSQLGDTKATLQALQKALSIIQPYTNIHTINIGGGLPVAYHPDEAVPDVATFVSSISPLLSDYTVLLEPGRSIVADAGILVTRILYTKEQGGQQFVIVDASISDLIRPALYRAYHHIVPVHAGNDEIAPRQVVGPVCETADIIGRDIALPNVQEGDLLAILTAGAYGMVMASNYNARTRPAEVVVQAGIWSIARHRETWEDLVRLEVE